MRATIHVCGKHSHQRKKTKCESLLSDTASVNTLNFSEALYILDCDYSSLYLMVLNT